MLSDTKFSGHMPDSIGKLEMLSWIELARCNFSGPIPSSIANLTRLLYLDLSSNGFTGSIPSFRSSKNLIHINLSRNYFTGQIISHHWEGFLNLLNLDLHHNLLHGDLPLSLFSHPSLQKIQLNQNQFSGQLNEFSVVSSFVLEVLDLSSNNLQGPIPLSVFDLRALHVLELSFNNLSGTLELSKFQELGNLTTLSLSHNKLSINVDSFNSSFSKSPHFTTLKLASCNLKRFPDLRNNSKFLGYLDLSQNQIQGEIPHWIWMIGNSFLVHLNPLIIFWWICKNLSLIFLLICLPLTYIPTCSMDESPPRPNFPAMWITQTTASSLPSRMILVLTCPSLFSSLFQRITSQESFLHPCNLPPSS